MHKLCDAPSKAEEDLKAELVELVGDCKTYVLGMGNEDRGDDGAGIAVARKLKESFPRHSYSEHDGLEGIVLDISEKDEDAFVIFVDAADLREEPGTIRLVDAKEIRATEVTTHRVTVGLLMELLAKSGKRSTVVCIQPGSVEFGSEMTAPVNGAVETLVCLLSDIVERTTS
ncbi:MAG: hydrogenase maturation protease [Methanobacteriota archaeon]|nr:MAG: hydrogenase maturation protease [Euryarchaeota archaeon]